MNTLKTVYNLLRIFLILFTCQPLLCQVKIIKFNKADTFRLIGFEGQLSFVDLREDTVNLGYVYRGLLNKYIPARLESPLTKEIDQLIPQNFKVSESKYFFRIKKLQINEFRRALYELSTCELIADLVEIRSDSTFIIGEQSAIVYNSALDVTKTHNRNIMKCFKQVIIKLHQNKSHRIFLGDIREIPKGPVLSLAKREVPNGIFRNFIEFKNNIPGLLQKDFTAIGYNPVSTSAIKFKDKNSNTLRDIWGFCDGKNYFIKVGYKYFRIEHHNADSAKFETQFKDYNEEAIFIGSFLFGALGAIATTALGKMSIDEVFLDLNTGIYAKKRIKKGILNKVQDSLEITFIRNEKTKFDHSITLRIDNELVHVFNKSRAKFAVKYPQSFKTYNISSDDHNSIDLKVSEEDQAIYFILETASKKVKIRKLDKGGTDWHLKSLENYEHKLSKKKNRS